MPGSANLTWQAVIPGLSVTDSVGTTDEHGSSKGEESKGKEDVTHVVLLLLLVYYDTKGQSRAIFLLSKLPDPV
jgi:hypothetical protein